MGRKNRAGPACSHTRAGLQPFIDPFLGDPAPASPMADGLACAV
jgi:hypothetical protein